MERVEALMMEEDSEGVLSDACQKLNSGREDKGRQKRALHDVSQDSLEDDSSTNRNNNNNKKTKTNINEPSTSNAEINNNYYLTETTTTDINDNNDRSAVIIIEPDADSTRQFFSNTTAVYRLLRSSVFGKAKILENTRNLRKKIQIIKIEDNTFIPEILMLHQLGPYKIICSLPVSSEFKCGVIGPIGSDTTPEDIVEELQNSGYHRCKAQRLIKGYGIRAVPTTMMKILIPIKKLPEQIIIMHEVFYVRPYVDRPWQCYNCQKFGHSAGNCTNRAKCVICAGEHKLADCPNKNDKEKNKCANCGANHTASYGGCKFIQKESDIQKIRAKDNISYRDAINKQTEKNTIHETEGCPIQNTINEYSYATVVARSDTTHRTPAKHAIIQKIVQTTEASTQTMIEASTNTNTEILLDAEDSLLKKIEAIIIKVMSENLINEKMATCMLEVACSATQNDTLKKKCSVVADTFSTHFQKEISSEILYEGLKHRLSGKGIPNITIMKTKKGTR